MWRKLICLAAVLAALSACGATGVAPTPNASVSVDANAPLTVQITQELSGQGLKVTNVQCPSDITREEGTTAACTGVVAGQTLNLTVTFAAGNEIIVAAAP